MTELINIKSLKKNYYLGTHVIHAIQNLTVSIMRGEFVAVMGPSGSGKSTLLNLMGCLDTPTDGQYFLDGVDVASLTRDQLALTRNRKIGFVFQNFNLLPRRTALDNVELPLLYGRVSKQNRRFKAEAVLEAVGLADRNHHVPSQLSGGQQQRVAIARAIVNEPSLILADEPTGAIDTRTGIEIMSVFQKLNRDRITIVLVTHEQEISRFASRILSFRDGRLIQDEVVENPKEADKILAEMPAEDRGETQ
ncbi:ABC transporter ATP-binding protein [Thermodesulfobacteriota bacterium]